jgi:hypothetical protein
MDRPRDSDLAARLFGAKPEHTLALLRAAWPAAVGAELARRTEVVALDRGVLRVKVQDLRWQRSLLRMRGDILSRLRRVAGKASPRAIGFVTGCVIDHGEPPPVPRADTPAPAPQPAPVAVTAAAGAIADPELRAQFLSVVERYLERFRAGQAGSPASGSGTTRG